MLVNLTDPSVRTRIMELYFKDLESDGTGADTEVCCAEASQAEVHGETAEDVAFAELAERVSAARLVY